MLSLRTGRACSKALPEVSLSPMSVGLCSPTLNSTARDAILKRRENTMESKTALVTGASRGLGRAIAEGLALEGWNLILTARHQQDLAAVADDLSKLTSVRFLAGDLTSAKHRVEIARAANDLDLVINNAGILGPSPQPELMDYPLDVLEDVYRTNVVAPLGLVQAVKNALKPLATIINITSDAAVEAYEGWGGYGSSKAALEHLSAILAVERPDLRVFWIDPGDMRTRMHQEAFPGENIDDRPLPETSVPGILSLIDSDRPSGRYRAREVEIEREADYAAAH